MNTNSRNDGIVADGLHRIRSSAEFQEREREIRKRVSQKYAWDLVAAPWWRRLFLRYRMEKEIQKDLDFIAPRGAQYLHPKILSDKAVHRTTAPAGLLAATCVRGRTPKASGGR